jgi:hypothetical protein
MATTDHDVYDGCSKVCSEQFISGVLFSSFIFLVIYFLKSTAKSRNLDDDQTLEEEEEEDGSGDEEEEEEEEEEEDLEKFKEQYKKGLNKQMVDGVTNNILASSQALDAKNLAVPSTSLPVSTAGTAEEDKVLNELDNVLQNLKGYDDRANREKL